MDADRSPKRILAVKLADLGDLLLCEPAFRSLRTAIPDARIDVLTTPNSIGLLDLIGHDLRPIRFPKHLFDRPQSLFDPRNQWEAARLALKLRSAEYDRVVILHHFTTAFGAKKFGWLARATGCRDIIGLDNGRGTFLTRRVIDLGFGARHESAYMRDIAVAAGGSDVNSCPKVTVPIGVEAPISLPETFAAIFPVTGPFSRAREWSPKRFGHVACRLRQRGIAPVVVGGSDALGAANAIRSIEPSAVDLSGQTSLAELAVVLARARLVIGGDSFVGHLAAAVGTPVVAIFGPSNADAWRPAGALDSDETDSVVTRSIVVRSRMPCEPCIYTGFTLGRPRGCPDRTCLKLVSVGDVDRAVTRVLGVA